MPVDPQDEGQAFEEVVHRLTERFPLVPGHIVESVVQAERRRLDGRPVRAFLPLLVERAAAERLREAVRGPESP
jgi:hypothetical protein